MEAGPFLDSLSPKDLTRSSPDRCQESVRRRCQIVLFGRKRKKCAENRIFFVICAYLKIKKTPFFELKTHFRGFIIPKYANYLPDNQIFNLLLKMPKLNRFINSIFTELTSFLKLWILADNQHFMSFF